MLQAWMGAFPDVVKPYTDISDDLLAHLRYPEDMFKVQRDILARYHVTNATTFYGGSENWKVPEDPTANTTDAKQPPYFLTIKLPKDVAAANDLPDDPEFSLTSVYEPNARQNLASFMAVNADAQSPDYGRFTVLELGTESAVSGPSQVSNILQNDPQVANKLLAYKQNGTTVQMGNLLTLPIGDELLYAQPVYTVRGGTGTGSYPILQFVAVSIGDRVGTGDSFLSALASALNLEVDNAPNNGGNNGNNGGNNGNNGGNNGSGQSPEEQVNQLLDQAKSWFDKADQALREGDLGSYQTYNRKGLAKLDDALQLRDQVLNGSGGTDGTGGSTPSDSSPSDSTPTDSSPSTGGG